MNLDFAATFIPAGRTSKDKARRLLSEGLQIPPEDRAGADGVLKSLWERGVISMPKHCDYIERLPDRGHQPGGSNEGSRRRRFVGMIDEFGNAVDVPADEADAERARILALRRKRRVDQLSEDLAHIQKQEQPTPPEPEQTRKFRK